MIDPATWPTFNHPMLGVVDAFKARYPREYFDLPAGYVFDKGDLTLGNLSSVLYQLQEGVSADTGETIPEPFRSDAIAAVHQLWELSDWRWQVWAALTPREDIIARAEDGSFVIRARLAETAQEYDLGDCATEAEAADAWRDLVRQAEDGTMPEERVGELLDEIGFHLLGEAGKLPPGLMAAWRENQPAK